MIYPIYDIAKLYSNIYVFNSLHQTQKYHSMKRNPKKNKWDNYDALGYETKKKKKIHLQRTVVLPLLYVFDLGRDSTASDHMRSH